MQQQELVAACNILSAILSVEHRAVQPHLADIWRLLWLAARGKECPAHHDVCRLRIVMVHCVSVKRAALQDHSGKSAPPHESYSAGT